MIAKGKACHTRTQTGWRNEPTGNHIKLTRHDAKFGAWKARDLAMVQGEN